MSAVNRTVMSVRSLFGGLGEGVVRALIDAETNHLSHYDQVLEASEPPADVRDILLKNRSRLEESIARMRASAA